jgi:4-carboxymuconolactone decarboxylase
VSKEDLMAHVAYIDSDDYPPVNIFRALLHRPEFLHSYRELGQLLLLEGDLDLRLKELVVTAVAVACDSSYLWSHHGDAARAAGVPDDQLAAVRAGQLDLLPAREAACVRFGQQVAIGGVDDADVGSIRSIGLDDRQVVELAMLASFYCMTARLLGGLGIGLEEGRSGLDVPATTEVAHGDG